MMVKARKSYFLYTNSDIVTIPKEMFKTDVKQQKLLPSRESKEINFLGRYVMSYL
jgi:hypothetical protein